MNRKIYLAQPMQTLEQEFIKAKRSHPSAYPYSQIQYQMIRQYIQNLRKRQVACQPLHKNHTTSSINDYGGLFEIIFFDKNMNMYDVCLFGVSV